MKCFVGVVVRPGLTHVSFVVLCTLLAAGASAEEARSPASEPAAEQASLGSGSVWKLHVELSAEEFRAIQPPAGGFGFGPGAPGGTPPRRPPAGTQRPRERNLFGTEFPWGRADLTVDGRSFPNVGLRYAGDASYLVAAGGLKRPWAVQLDRFEKQDLSGLTSIQLHSGSLDPSRIREAVAFAWFRAAGVPASRTAFAEVSLSVPGRYDREYLGLFTVVESVDAAFLKDRFQSDQGLLMKPARMRGPDYFGEDWERYRATYQPQSEPTAEQSRRVIEFARLINESSDDDFRARIETFLDVEEFLRLLAANALLANVETYFGLGHNYSLYLHPETLKFHFIQGDLELSLANFLLMGSAEQLMDMSLTHPYPGECRLTDRLLATDRFAESYRTILNELSADASFRERLFREIESAEAHTKDIIAREATATAARREPPAGFGPPAGAAPRPPELRTFVERRIASVTRQLAGEGTGYVPVFSFGPPPPGGPGGRPAEPPVTDETIATVVQAPDEFEVTLFAAPPRLGYPVAVAATPAGEVFVAVDEQGSLGRTPGGGRIVRCVDTDDDGRADQFSMFARMEHPRGVIVQGRTVWVMHPPTLSVYHDDDSDGVADRSDVLVTGLTTELIDTRGGDHTTDGIRMGVDGWIYIGDGDYGIKEARGKDGATVSMRGGGILRVRPDGTELEVFATGLRNPFDIAIDPYLNLFTRDNTNDGAGWDVRVSHLFQTAQYGYTQLYANFPDEIMPPLGSFGGGGGTGALFIEQPDWPEPFRRALYTGDWGRSEVYRHDLEADGPSFRMGQEVFLRIPRPTGMDVDGRGRLYVASWRGGEASVFVGPQVGFIARVSPRGLAPQPAPALERADLRQLIGRLSDASSVVRLHSQREIIRRGPSAESTQALERLSADGSARLSSRIAALFALKQLDGLRSHATLWRLAADPAVREFALRALTDRRSELEGVETAPFVAALADSSPRVRAQAVISLARLGDPSVAAALLPLTARREDSPVPSDSPIHAQPDPDRVIPHLATRALVSLQAVETCLAALDGPYQDGALRALRDLHRKDAVGGLIRKLGTAFSTELRHSVLSTLARLYHREAEYDGSWWGIRPDNTGPYWDPRTWELSERIGAVLTSALLDGDAPTVQFLSAELERHQVSLPGLPATFNPQSSREDEAQVAITIPHTDPGNPNQIGNLTYDVAARRTLSAQGDRDRGKALFTSQSCRVCHTDADGQTPKGPHLVDIGKRYKPEELIESILRPSAKLAQGFETWAFETIEGRVISGFVVRERAGATLIRQLTGLPQELKKAEIESRKRVDQSSMPEKIVDNLTPEQLADLIAYLQSLE